jgi:hypothetical protein
MCAVSGVEGGAAATVDDLYPSCKLMELEKSMKEIPR